MYGAKEFFIEYRKNANDEIGQQIDALLKAIVNESLQSDNQENYHYSINSQCTSSSASVAMSKHKFLVSTIGIGLRWNFMSNFSF